MKRDKKIKTLYDNLQRLYQCLYRQMEKKWGRALPFEEMLFDRWTHAEILGFGKGTSIHHLSYVYGDVKVGRGIHGLGPLRYRRYRRAHDWR